MHSVYMEDTQASGDISDWVTGTAQVGIIYLPGTNVTGDLSGRPSNHTNHVLLPDVVSATLPSNGHGDL